MNRVVLPVVLSALVALLVPAGAAASAASASAVPGFLDPTQDAPAGVTVAGIGFGPTGAVAAEHAVRDARDRAAMVAVALNADIGALERIEVPELTQFLRSSESCRRTGNRERPCPKVAAAIVTFAVAGAGGASAGAWAVGSSATGSAPVEPRNRKSDRWIKRGIVRAREAATKEAAATALRNARAAATAADLKLGQIVSVVEVNPPSLYPLPPFYVPSFSDPLLGLLAPGTFCGTVTRPTVRRDPETGRRKIVRRVTRRRCLFPRTYEAQLEVKYTAG